MPHAIKRDQELSKLGLVTILLESQGSNDIEAFMYKTFKGNGCMVAKRSGALPIRDTSPGIPACALIGVDGTLLAEGLFSKIGAEVEELIQKEIRKAMQGWGATKDLAKARAALYGKKLDVQKAQKLAEQAKVESDEEKADLEALKSEIETKIATLEKSARYLMEEGRWLEAEEAAQNFLKAVKGNDQREAAAKELVAQFSSKEGKAELKLAKSLAKIERIVDQKGVSGPEIPALEKMAESAGDDSKVGARALRLAGWYKKATE